MKKVVINESVNKNKLIESLFNLIGKNNSLHSFKIDDKWFEEIKKGKRFEIRKDDRPNMPIKNDIVWLDAKNKGVLIKVVYTLSHHEAPNYIKYGYCVFGFELLNIIE